MSKLNKLVKNSQYVSDILDVRSVEIALKIIYSRFWDPLCDEDQNLIDGIESLQKYCLSKPVFQDIVNADSMKDFYK